jgi:hypothetical protein
LRLCAFAGNKSFLPPSRKAAKKAANAFLSSPRLKFRAFSRFSRAEPKLISPAPATRLNSQKRGPETEKQIKFHRRSGPRFFVELTENK